MNDPVSAPSPSSFGQERPYQPAPAGPPTSGMAVTSMIFGILGFFCGTGLIGAILGHLASRRIKRANGALGGAGFALTGIITGWLSLVFALLAVGSYVAMFMAFSKMGDFSSERLVQGIEFTSLEVFGESLYEYVYNDAIDANIVGFPRAGQYTNSCDYLRALAGNNSANEQIYWLPADSVAGPRMAKASDWDTLSADNNGWCIVEGLDQNTPPDMPFAISANVLGNSLGELRGRVGNSLDLNHPMGDEVAVIVLHGGEGKTLLADDTWEDIFDTDFRPNAKILRP